MFRWTMGAALALSVSGVTAAYADWRPAPEEEGRIAAVLRAEGYTKWDKIRIDDDNEQKVDVDDACHKGGQTYDLYLDRQSLKIVHRDHETSRPGSCP